MSDELAQVLEMLGDVFPGAFYLGGRLTTRTLYNYRNDGAHYFQFCALDKDKALDASSLRAWREHMVKDTLLSPNTINGRLVSVKSLVRASAAMGLVDEAVAYQFSLVERVKPSALRHRLRADARVPVTPEEMRRICRMPDPTTLIGLRDRAFLHTLASSGCRLSEVLSLSITAVSHAGNNCHVEVVGKNQAAPRRAPLSKEALGWIQRWLKARSAHVTSTVVFTRFDQGCLASEAPMHRHEAWRRVKMYARAAGLPAVKPHDFRRHLGTRVTEKFGIRQAQKALGHASIETTARHYVLDELKPGLSEGLY